MRAAGGDPRQGGLVRQLGHSVGAAWRPSASVYGSPPLPGGPPYARDARSRRGRTVPAGRKDR
jgi:hypothetical protein